MAIAGSFGLSYPIITYTHSLINTDFPDSLRSQKQSTCFSACWVFVPKKGPLLFAFSVVVPIFATRKRRDCGLFIEFMGCFCCHGRREALFFAFCFAGPEKLPIFAPRFLGTVKGARGAAKKNNFFLFCGIKKTFYLCNPETNGALGATPREIEKKRSTRWVRPSEDIQKPAREATGAKFLKEKIIM